MEYCVTRNSSKEFSLGAMSETPRQYIFDGALGESCNHEYFLLLLYNGYRKIVLSESFILYFGERRVAFPYSNTYINLTEAYALSISRLIL